MTDKRISLLSAIPQVIALVGCAFLFVSYANIASNTGNILAWGFYGIGSLRSSELPLFLYEFAHFTPTYSYLLAGLWLAGLVALTLRMRQAMTVGRAWAYLWTIWTIGFLSCIGINAALIKIPADHEVQYLVMMIDGPGDKEHLPTPMSYGYLMIPALAALCYFFSKRGKLPGASSSVCQTLPLLVAPFVLANYLGFHFMCTTLQDSYGEDLKRLSYLLLASPVALLVVFEVIANKWRTSR